MDSGLNTFGAWSYGVSAVGFLMLGALMLASWKGKRGGAALIVAVAVSASWSILLALQSTRGVLPAHFIHIGEGLQDLGWIAALVTIAGKTVGRGLKILAVLGAIAACLAAPIALFLETAQLMYSDPTLLLSRSQLGTSLAGLVLLEQMYRNSTHSTRQTIKYFAIGVGVIFAYDLFLYSSTELLRGLSLETWSARGFVIASSIPLIALSAQRTPDWSLDVFISRQVVFFSTTFLIVGAYLSVMAMGGYYVREFGGEWGRIGQVVFFAGAAVALAGLLASNSLRRRSAVFISKHFYRNKYDYRVEWLRFIQTLSSTEEKNVRRTAVRAIAQIFDSPGGVMLLRNEELDAFEPAAAWPMDLDAIPAIARISVRDDLPSFLSRTTWIIDLQEFRRAPDTYGNIVIPQWLFDAEGLRILAPLMQLDEVVGFICLFEPPPPFNLTYEDRDLLKTVGRHVATHIAQDDASRKLSESRQFEAYNRLTAFMMHDLKNSVAQLKLIVDNSSRHRRNPEFVDDAIATVGNAVERMSRLIEQLRGGSAGERMAVVDLSSLAETAAVRCQDRVPRPTVKIDANPQVSADAERLTTVIEHIIRNAQDATDERGSVTVMVEQRDEHASLSVTDTGAGMEADFIRSRLFRPFDSTKGAKGMGIGAYQAREYIRSIGGNIEVRSAPRIGTTFSFMLPVVAAATADGRPQETAAASG